MKVELQYYYAERLTPKDSSSLIVRASGFALSLSLLFLSISFSLFTAFLAQPQNLAILRVRSFALCSVFLSYSFCSSSGTGRQCKLLLLPLLLLPPCRHTVQNCNCHLAYTSTAERLVSMRHYFFATFGSCWFFR